MASEDGALFAHYLPIINGLHRGEGYGTFWLVLTVLVRSELLPRADVHNERVFFS